MNSAETQGYREEANSGLLDRCRMRDPEAYNEFFSLYNRRILNTAYRILGEESSAEDALQETLLNVSRGLASFRGDSKVSTWISRITVNVCLGMLRRGKNWQSIDTDDESASEIPADVNSSTDPLEHASHEEIRALVEETFGRMSGKQAVVVRLHDMEGHTIQEIAHIIHCPAGTVKSRLFYGRQEFKDIYSALLQRRGRRPTIQ